MINELLRVQRMGNDDVWHCKHVLQTMQSEFIEQAYLDLEQSERRMEENGQNEEFRKFYYRTNFFTMIKEIIMSREGMWHAWETLQIREKFSPRKSAIKLPFTKPRCRW